MDYPQHRQFSGGSIRNAILASFSLYCSLTFSVKRSRWSRLPALAIRRQRSFKLRRRFIEPCFVPGIQAGGWASEGQSTHLKPVTCAERVLQGLK
jgi:hypothetical protein